MARKDRAPYSSEEVLALRGHILGILGSLLDKMPTGRDVEVEDPLSVWMLAPGVVKHSSTRDSLLELATDTGRWHHQVKLQGAAQAFARSAPSTEVTGLSSLRSVFLSTLAEKINRALGWVEKNLSPDPLVRLLEAPAYQVRALLLIDDSQPGSGSLRLLGLHAPPQLGSLNQSSLLTSAEFVACLRSVGPVSGITTERFRPMAMAAGAMSHR